MKSMFVLLGISAIAAAGSDYKVLERYKVGGPGRWDVLTVDAAHHRLFISRSDHVQVIDTNDGKELGTIADTQGVHAIALVPGLEHGFTSNGKTNTLTEFDAATLKTLRAIPAGGDGPDVLLYDDASKHLFVFNGGGKNAAVIDPAKGSVVATIALDAKPEFAVSDGKGHLFVNAEDTAEIKRIDTRANRVDATWKLADCEEPTGIAFDAAHARLFSACQNGKMVVTDAKTGKPVASAPIGKGVDGLAFDAARGLVFSPNGADGTLTVIHEDAPDKFSVIATVATQKSARTIAFDASTHKVYTVAAEFGPAPAPTAEQPHPRAPMIDGSFTVLAIGAP